MVSALGRHIQELNGVGPTADVIRELKRLLYGLDAVLRLHFAQEDESYLALLASENGVDDARAATGVRA